MNKNHKIGDIVRITDNASRHQLTIGSLVEIKSLHPAYDGCYHGGGWHFTDAECEVVFSTKPMTEFELQEKPASPRKLKVLGIKSIQSSLITESRKWVTIEDEEAEELVLINLACKEGNL